MNNNAERIQISLAAARVNAGLTQEDVAKEFKVSKQTVVNWEKGKVMPSLLVMRALSEYYRIPIDNIFCLKNPLKVISRDTLRISRIDVT